MLGHEADELMLDLRPERIVAAAFRVAETELALDPGYCFGDAAIVIVDAVAGDVADRQPVGGLEMPLCRARTLAKQRIVTIESVPQNLRDVPWRRLVRRRRRIIRPWLS
jgi:hypothetical protein